MPGKTFFLGEYDFSTIDFHIYKMWLDVRNKGISTDAEFYPDDVNPMSNGYWYVM